MSNILTHERLKELLHYDADTGIFTRISSPRQFRIGVIKTTADGINGYFQIGLLDKLYKSHRLAWFYVHGEWPTNQLDHINRDKIDNRLVNLREATRAENKKNVIAQKNNTSGYKGVSYFKRRRKWVAQICTNGKRTYLGCYTTAAEASRAYESAAKLHHGNFYYNHLEAA